jgi:hypothetical protein
MGMDWIAKSTRRVQCPVTPIVESSTTVALDDSRGGFFRKISVPLQNSLLICGIVFFDA